MQVTNCAISAPLISVAYPARMDNKPGYIIVDNKHDGLHAPQITFVPANGTEEAFVWAIDDIVEIKKVSIPSFVLLLVLC